ncbi:uncharacterized protein N7487_007248 [Penicillium crustosum]|uniref:uncharacterized protein n=1 Tax=Penicillium crustosum TaxID=36656 RepID=UPI002384D26B|nr:uncharacterized protein N7487_007248 [Penicillium crustosum]KAJ5401352.1 hypothetical protein N7487_007248 [Penicillium crustosum]
MQLNEDVLCTLLLLFKPRSCPPSPHFNGHQTIKPSFQVSLQIPPSRSTSITPVDPFFIDWSGPNLEMAYASPVVVLKKGAKKSSHVRHTSKQTQPLRRFRDEDGKASSDGRNRRLLGSSDDDGDFMDDGFINHDFRVGGPNLCPLPAETYEIQDSHPLYPIIDELQRRMLSWIFAVLREFDIEDDHIDPVDVVGRADKDDSEGIPQLTVIILAARTVVDDTWLNVARVIQASLLSYLPMVAVEISTAWKFVLGSDWDFLELAVFIPHYQLKDNILEQL